VEYASVQEGWWSFAKADLSFCGMPLALYVGWVLLWGAVPVFAFPKIQLRWVTLIMICVDLAGMPLAHNVVSLSPRWLIGEAIAVLVVLLPALAISRWTMEQTHLHARAMLQIATAGLVFLFLIPELFFALRPGAGWKPLIAMPSWLRQICLQAVFLLAVPGISAVLEFAERGDGTPIPYDPPKRLVTSGIYRYVANPMQLFCALTMLAWAALLQSGWMALGAAVSLIYSAGIAEWDEAQDLRRRFGEPWVMYRSEVRNWLPGWRPYAGASQARLYIAESCAPCSEVWLWLAQRRPVGMQIVAAETLPAGSIRRMRYEPGDESASVDGVRAFARALEHLHFGWALVGAMLRLPGIWQMAQMLMDASGFGPRTILPVRSQARRHS
jgi:protein-S-isoprenylcysteine O-methyltransferase Ste14